MRDLLKEVLTGSRFNTRMNSRWIQLCAQDRLWREKREKRESKPSVKKFRGLMKRHSEWMKERGVQGFNRA